MRHQAEIISVQEKNAKEKQRTEDTVAENKKSNHQVASLTTHIVSLVEKLTTKKDESAILTIGM